MLHLLIVCCWCIKLQLSFHLVFIKFTKHLIILIISKFLLIFYFNNCTIYNNSFYLQFSKILFLIFVLLHWLGLPGKY